MDNNIIQSRFTEVVAKTLDHYDQQQEGKWPPFDHNRWKQRYSGTPEEDLPPYTVVFNKFKPVVDMTVCQLMMAMDDDLWSQSTNPVPASEL